MARILVAGADDRLCELCAFWLTRDGHQVVVAPTLPDDVRPPAPERFDLVIVDCDATGQSCSAVTRAIRDLPGQGDAPIIMLTADAPALGVEEPEAPGIEAHLDKPFPLRRLSALVDRMLAAG